MFLSMLTSVANEVMEETGSKQRFGSQGQALRRTEHVDPQYHADLRMRRQIASDHNAKMRIGSLSLAR